VEPSEDEPVIFDDIDKVIGSWPILGDEVHETPSN
jgi:hypothetical protein